MAATSSRNAWAVGIDPAVILRWNGTAWKRQASAPIPAATFTFLYGVTATSTRNAWAAGTFSTRRGSPQALIEHWNGMAWKRVRTAALSGAGAEFLGIAALSPRNMWAVGDYQPSGGRIRTLIEHWNGTAWKHVPSPNPGGLSRDNTLSAVSVISGQDAWAVGRYTAEAAGQDASKTVILHWNGKAWRHITSPNPGWGSYNLPNDLLTGVTAVSPRDVWAVGIGNDKSGLEQTLIEHWNGKAWKRVPSPIASPQTPGGPRMESDLFGVAATAAGNVWAVGQSFPMGGLGPSAPLALHCC